MGKEGAGKGGKALTSTQPLIIASLGTLVDGRRLRPLEPASGPLTDDTAAILLSAPSLSDAALVLGLAGPRRVLVAAGPAPLRLSQQLAQLEKVRLDGGDEAFGLAVLGRGADGHAAVFDDVADAETVAGRGAEAEVPERRVAAVGGREDSRVKPVPARVGEEAGC